LVLNNESTASLSWSLGFHGCPSLLKDVAMVKH
jgi:hypothetical protein